MTPDDKKFNDALNYARASAAPPPIAPPPSDDAKFDAALNYVRGGRAAGAAQEIRNSAQFSGDANPIREARFQHLSRTLGIPVESVRAFPENANDQYAAKHADADKIAENAPVTARTVGTVDGMRQYKDSIPGLVGIERAARTESFSMQDFKESPEAFIKGFGGFSNQLISGLGLALAAPAMAMDAMTNAHPLQGKPTTANRDFVFKYFVDPFVQNQSAFDVSSNGFVSKLAAATGGLVGMLPYAMVGGAPAAVPASAGVAAATRAMVEQGIKSAAIPSGAQAIDTVRGVYEATGSLPAAMAAGVTQYGASTAQMIVPVTAAGGLVNRTITGAVGGVVGGEVGRRMMNPVLPDAMKREFDYEQMAIDGVIGGAMGGAAVNMRGGRDANALVREMYVEAQKAGEALQGADAVRKIGDFAAGVKVREIDPTGFHEFVTEVANESNTKDLYVDVRKFTETMNQAGVTIDELAQKLPEVAAQIQEATQTNGLVRIGIADYATHIAGGKLDQVLFQEMKTSPDGMTFRQAETYQKEVAQGDMMKQAEKLIKANEKDSEYQQQVKEVFDARFAEHKGAGRFNKETNRVYATMDTAFVVTQADRQGMTPAEFMKKYPPPSVRAESIVGGENVLDQSRVRSLALKELAAPAPKGVKTIEQLTQYLQDKIGTKKELDDPKARKESLRMLAEEYDAQMRSEKSGADWYDTDIGTAFKVMEDIFPSLKEPDQKGLFAVINGITSAQTKVYQSWREGADAYRRYLNTGELPTSDPVNGALYRGGDKAGAFNMLNNMLKDMGVADAIEFLYSKHSVRELNAMRVEYGAYGPNGISGKAGDEILGLLMFGPKVGQFMANLMGLDGVTVDKWLVRTYGRWYGDMYDSRGKPIDAPTDRQRKHIQDILTEFATERGVTPQSVQAVLWYFEQALYRHHGAYGESRGFYDAAKEYYAANTGNEYVEQRGGGGGAEANATNALKQSAVENQRVANEPALDGLPRTVKVDGKDVTFGPFKPAREAAAQYATTAGMVYDPPNQYVKVNEERATRIADEFEKMKHDPENPEVKAAYDAMIAETLAQWEAIKKTGLKVEFITGDDPYGNPRNAILDVVNNNHLWVYPTDAGFGGSESAGIDVSGNPLLRIVEGETISGRKVQANDIFRIVHDYFGHIKEGTGFRADGEENAWRAHSAMYSPLARRAMTAETRGQNSWVNFGPFGEQNRSANGAETQYAPQKVGLLPEWVSTEGAGDRNTLSQSPKDTAVSVEGIHFSKEARTNLSGGAYGTGAKGAEAERVSASADPRIKRRVALYVNTGNGITPEQGVGGVPHRVEARNLYDADADPQNLYANARGDMNAFESSVLDAGLSGYVTRSFGTQGAAVLLNAPSVPVKAEAPASRVDNARVIEAPVLSDEKVLRKNFLSNPALPAGALDSAGWKKTLERVAPDMIPYLGNALDFTGTRYKDELLRAVLNQGERGQISFGRNIQDGAQISLLKDADLSTYIHESGHWYTEVMVDLANQADAPPQTLADVQTLLKWSGAGDLAQWNAMSFEGRRVYHEKIARGIEAYLFEGKAPTPELQPVFARIRSWMLAVYKALKNLDADLTPEVRTVFDRMLATDSAIAQAQHIREMAAMFDSKPEGMSDADYVEYQNLGAQATEMALNELGKRGLRDMKWLSNAKSKAMKELQKEANNRRVEIRDQVTKEVMAEPVNVAREFLKTGEMKDAEGNDIKLTEGFRLNTEAIKEMYPETSLSKPDTSKLRGLTAKDGLAPDLVAQMFGFTSGDHLIRDLINAENVKEKIAGLTDQRMLEQHGDLVDPVSIERAAEAAIHNDARAKFIATELRALTQAIGSPRDLAKAAKLAAETAVNAKRLRDLTPGKYAAAESTSGKASTEAFKKGDTETAAIEKRAQLLNNALVKAILNAQETAKIGATYLKKFSKEGTRKNLDADYLDQIDAILENYDLKTRSNKETDRRKSYANWAKAQEEMKNPPVVSADQLADMLRVPIKDMTVEQFQGLVDTVKNIEHLGRLKEKRLTALDNRLFAQVVQDVSTSVRENATETVPPQLEKNKVRSAIDGFFASHRKMANIVREFDGWKDGGKFWEVFTRPMNDASERENSAREEAAIKLNELFNEVRKEGKFSKTVLIPEIKNSLSKEARLAIALNWGNESNRQRVMDGDKWTRRQVEAILNTLSKKDWDFVQNVWNFIDSYWADSAAKHRRVTGVALEKLERVPVETKHGTYDGGYYPIKYDTDRSSRAEADDRAAAIKQAMQGAYTRSTTRRGRLEARAAEVHNRPVSKSLEVIFSHVNEAIHDVSWHEFLIDANRLLNSPEIDASIRDHHGVDLLRALKSGLDDIAVGDIPAQSAFERSMNYLRTGATIAGLGWNLSTALLQPLGLTQSMVRIGPKWVAKGMLEFFGDAARMENTAAKIAAKSDMMRLRAKTLNRDISEVRNTLDEKGKVRSAVELSAFYMITKLQLVADIPTWLGQYEKSIASGADEARAIALADQAVLDAQGGGSIKDLAQIQRGGALQKLFTTFYSFFSTTHNLAAEIKGRTNVKDPLAVGRAATDYLLLFVIPAAMATLMKAALKGELDDEEALKKKLLADQMNYLLGTMVGVRELGATASAVAGEYSSYGGPASVRFFAETLRLGKQAYQGEVDAAALKAANSVGGILFHYPSGQVQRTAEGVKAMSEGKTANPLVLMTGPKKEDK